MSGPQTTTRSFPTEALLPMFQWFLTGALVLGGTFGIVSLFQDPTVTIPQSLLPLVSLLGNIGLMPTANGTIPLFSLLYYPAVLTLAIFVVGWVILYQDPNTVQSEYAFEVTLVLIVLSIISVVVISAAPEDLYPLLGSLSKFVVVLLSYILVGSTDWSIYQMVVHE
jgi:hypothetical protein